jgi:FecR-like protein
LSGTLSVTRANGALLVLSQKSEVFPGDVLLTQKDSYAQINFTDGSSLTMRPLTQIRLDEYSYVADKPAGDSAFFRLLKGGMRTVTGLIGKRGNQNAYRIGTATATIGIRGSTGDTMVCNPNCDGVAKGAETLPSGTHHQTHSGAYTMQIDDKVAGSERVYLVQAAQSRGHTVMTDEPRDGGVLLAQAGSKIVVIEEGHTGYSNGVEIKVTVGGIGGGKVDLYLPTGGGLKDAAGCK